jgi:hypothetical protein
MRHVPWWDMIWTPGGTYGPYYVSSRGRYLSVAVSSSSLLFMRASSPLLSFIWLAISSPIRQPGVPAGSSRSRPSVPLKPGLAETERGLASPAPHLRPDRGSSAATAARAASGSSAKQAVARPTVPSHQRVASAYAIGCGSQPGSSRCDAPRGSARIRWKQRLPVSPAVSDPNLDRLRHPGPLPPH